MNPPEMERATANEYPCTVCGKDAFIGYGKGWGGLVRKGERLCTRCFQERGGKRILWVNPQ
jgi:hypothetical protein